MSDYFTQVRFPTGNESKCETNHSKPMMALVRLLKILLFYLSLPQIGFPGKLKGVLFR